MKNPRWVLLELLAPSVPKVHGVKESYAVGGESEQPPRTLQVFISSFHMSVQIRCYKSQGCRSPGSLAPTSSQFNGELPLAICLWKTTPPLMCELVLTQQRRAGYGLMLPHFPLGQLSFQVNKGGFICAPQHSILIFQQSPGELNQ